MNAIDAFLAIPETPLHRKGCGAPRRASGRRTGLWHIDKPDKDPRDEIARQSAFLRDARIQCPSVDIVAVPNSGRRSDWEMWQRTREGMKAGALDLFMTWEPTRRGDRGCAYLEFKDGTEWPDENQCDRLDMYVRQGHNCGVVRHEASALALLRRWGAPFLMGERLL